MRRKVEQAKRVLNGREGKVVCKANALETTEREFKTITKQIKNLRKEKNMSKKLKAFVFIIMLSLLLSLSFNGLSYADDLPPVESTPPESVIRNADPLGTYYHTIKNPNIKHTENIFYTDYFDGIYIRYDGYHDRGIVAICGPNNTPSTNTLTYTIRRTVSNSFSTGIGASADFISAHVGCSVTASTEKSWSYTVSIPPYSTVYLHYRDWYHVQQFYCHRHYWLTGSDHYGTGWAEQWYAPQFYTTTG